MLHGNECSLWGSKADIATSQRDVCFTLNSGLGASRRKFSGKAVRRLVLFDHIPAYRVPLLFRHPNLIYGQ